jgi:hypothetical protein
MASTGVPPGDRRAVSRGCLRDRRQGARIVTGRREGSGNLARKGLPRRADHSRRDKMMLSR